MPKWSPDGTHIAFDGNAGDGWEIFLIKPDGTGLTRLTRNDTLDANASWSPDGTRIVHQCQRNETRTLCLLALDRLTSAGAL